MVHMNDRLEGIETKIAYVEHANAQLGEVVLQQAREIEALTAMVASLRARLDSGKVGESPWSAEEERPPHY